MKIIQLFRISSLVVLAGSIASLVMGNGAFAQNVQTYTPAPQSTSSPAQPQSQPAIQFIPADSGTNALNWAGYVATGGTYTSVSGSWIVPTVSAGTAENVADATWVGIGGVTSKDLIQAGTEALPDSNGTIAYRAWMELLPQDSQIVPLTISPGDSVSVSITEESSGTWDVSFTNATTGKVYQTTVQYNSSLSSADWVEEMPVEVGGIVGLDNFGSIHFTSGYAIKNGEPVTIATSGAEPLTMDNSEGMTVAAPSELDASGTSFSVLRTSAASTPLALTGNGISAVAVDRTGSFASAGTNGGGYTTRIHRSRGGYRVYIQF